MVVTNDMPPFQISREPALVTHEHLFKSCVV